MIIIKIYDNLKLDKIRIERSQYVRDDIINYKSAPTIIKMLIVTGTESII